MAPTWLFEASTLHAHEKHVCKYVLNNMKLLSRNTKVVGIGLVNNSLKSGMVLNHNQLFSID